MNKLFNSFRFGIVFCLLLNALFLLFAALYSQNTFDELIIIFLALIINVVFVLVFYFLALKIINVKNSTIKNSLALNYENSLNFANVGLVLYDETGSIVFINDYLKDLDDKNYIGQKLVKWIPDLQKILNDNAKKIIISYKNLYFQVRLNSITRTLVFKDITEYRTLLWKLTNDQVVFGILAIDNWVHTLNALTETKSTRISNVIKSLIASWAEKHHIFLKNYSHDSYFLFMNQKDFLNLEQKKFKILEEIKIKSKELKIDLSLSLGLAYGTNDYNKLYNLAQNNLEFAQARGGDQVVVRNFNFLEPKFYGKQKPVIRSSSQVKVKKFARRLATLCSKSSNILISGHKFADYDCIAAGLAFYHLAKLYNDDVKICLDFKHLDKNASDNLTKIIPKEALESIYLDVNKFPSQIQSSTLLIIVDTHVPSRVEISEALKLIKNVVVVDHHIRNPNQIENATDYFIEPTSSSTSEIAMEVLRYQEIDINLPKWVATLMLTGIFMDTNFFKMRTGKRTFEAASILQEVGADFIQAQNLLKDSESDQKIKFNILKNVEKVQEHVYFVPADPDQNVDRSLIAQVAQSLVQIQDAYVGIAVANDPTNVNCMSSRSNGLANVISFAKDLGGGGHFDAAACQDNDLDYEEFVEKVRQKAKEWNFNIETNSD